MAKTVSGRVEVADALRGLAVMAIILLHSIEHFNFYSYPSTAGQSAWLNFTDRAIWDGLFFAFGGKAYAVFALLFGFSFYVMYSHQESRGRDFRLRFCWRMVLLFLLGNLNAAFFTGEVLVLYSLVGFVLPLVCRLSNRAVFWLAVVCLLQPLALFELGRALCLPGEAVGAPPSAYYWAQAYPVLREGDFWDTLRMNLWSGQLASLTWAWENARVFQTAALFMLGMLAGRNGWFCDTTPNRYLWGRTMGVALLAFFPLYGLANLIPSFVTDSSVRTPLLLIVSSLHKFCFMLFEVTLVLFAFYCTRAQRLLRAFMPYGRMSLTNYIVQSIVGSMLFYHWGFSLHDNLGITASLCMGAVLFLLQWAGCRWWMKRHNHGPLEYVWKRLTWLGA